MHAATGRSRSWVGPVRGPTGLIDAARNLTRDESEDIHIWRLVNAHPSRCVVCRQTKSWCIALDTMADAGSLGEPEGARVMLRQTEMDSAFFLHCFH
jgi:hypothetical protein